MLLTLDEDLAREARAAGCRTCGGRLHSARYPRKPRGGPEDLGPDFTWRLSFCCDQDGCRRRTTPLSVRYLGRRVHLGAVVADEARDLAAARGVADMHRALQIEGFDKRREIVGVRVQIVAVSLTWRSITDGGRGLDHPQSMAPR